MKVITIMELKEGMEIAEPVLSQDKVLFPADTILDSKMIDRIKRHGIMCITIKTEVDYATTHYEKIHYDEEFKTFRTVYNKALTIYKGVMLSYLGTGQSVDPNILIALYETVSQKIKTEAQLLDYLYNMDPNDDELTYTQSFNAALLCGAFSNWLGFSQEDKKIFILCGFYYDIGKWKMPSSILWKPGKLTEEEFAMVKKHPVLGYAIVRNDPNLNEHVKNAVIMHHERYDGSGYPYHMVGSKIDRFACYMAVVDSYIAMASPRSYRPAFTPLQIVGTFEKDIIKYDTQIVLPLMSKIADTQIGSKIQLSDDSVWEIIMIQKPNYSRPMLKGDHDMILDLNSRPDLKIVKLV